MEKYELMLLWKGGSARKAMVKSCARLPWTALRMQGQVGSLLNVMRLDGSSLPPPRRVFVV